MKKIKLELNDHMLLEKIWKAVETFMQQKTFIKKEITAIKNYASTLKLSYSNIASQGHKKICYQNSNYSFYCFIQEIETKLSLD